jgi:uncharacterized LabA/DUF88 family protein
LKSKVVIFLDYQNIIKTSKQLFKLNQLTHISPTILGVILLDRFKGTREIKEIRVYTGIPSKRREAKSYSRFNKRISCWKLDPKVTVINRPISYPMGWPNKSAPGDKPREKGIDVKIAVDFVTMAIKKDYEIGILFSLDSDLKPALEFVCQNDLDVKAEVIAWRTNRSHQLRLALSGNKPFCHWLTIEDLSKMIL